LGWHGPATSPNDSLLDASPLPTLPLQYSLWLDGHSQEESLKFIRTALEACAPKAKGAPGFEEFYPLLKRLAA
jgi:hypothetical protein